MKESDKTLFLLSHIIEESVTDILYHIYSSHQAAHDMLTDYYIVRRYEQFKVEMDGSTTGPWRAGMGTSSEKKKYAMCDSYEEAIQWCAEQWIKNKEK